MIIVLYAQLEAGTFESARPEQTGYHGTRTTSQPNTRDQLTTTNNSTIQQERSATLPTSQQQAENNLQSIRPPEVAPHRTANNSQHPAVRPQIISQQNVQVTPQLAANQSQPPADKSQRFLPAEYNKTHHGNSMKIIFPQ